MDGCSVGRLGVTAKPIWVSFLTGRVGGGGQGNDTIADSKYIHQVNTREGAEVFKLKDDAGTRTDDNKYAKNKFRQETRIFFNCFENEFWNSFQIRLDKKISNF